MTTAKKRYEDALQEDLDRIEHIMSLTGVGAWYKAELQKRTRDIYEQLAKSIKVGKIMQDMLLDYMSPGEIVEKLNSRMLIAHIEDDV